MVTEKNELEGFISRLHPEVVEIVKTSMLLTLGKMIETHAKNESDLAELEDIHFGADKGSW